MPSCPTCNNPVAGGDVFCTSCGADLRVAAAAAAPGAAPPPPQQPAAAPPAPAASAPAPGAPLPPPPTFGTTPEPPPLPPKKTSAGAVVAIVLSVLLVCGLGTAAAGYFGYRQWAKPTPAASTSAEKPASSTEKPDATPEQPATTLEQPADGSAVLPDESTPDTIIDDKGAAALVEKFVSASMKNDVPTAQALIAPATLERIGGVDALKQQGVINSYKVASVEGSDNVYDVWVDFDTTQGAIKQKFTVGVGEQTPMIVDVVMSEY